MACTYLQSMGSQGIFPIVFNFLKDRIITACSIWKSTRYFNLKKIRAHVNDMQTHCYKIVMSHGIHTCILWLAIREFVPLFLSFFMDRFIITCSIINLKIRAHVNDLHRKVVLLLSCEHDLSVISYYVHTVPAHYGQPRCLS